MNNIPTLYDALSLANGAKNAMAEGREVPMMAMAAIELAKEIEILDQARRVYMDRAEAAEAELRKAREQEPVAEYDGVEFSRYTLRWINGQLPVGTKFYAEPVFDRAAEENRFQAEELEALHMCLRDYNVPVLDENGKKLSAWGRVVRFVEMQAIKPAAPAATAVPEEWLDVLTGLVNIADAKGTAQGSPNHRHSKPGIWDPDNRPELRGKPCAECAVYDRARALLQTTGAKP